MLRWKPAFDKRRGLLVVLFDLETPARFAVGLPPPTASELTTALKQQADTLVGTMLGLND